jgi:MinD superfamily P-loop ATPase
MTLEVKAYCQENNIPLLGEIPFDEVFIQANLDNEALTEIEGGEAAVGLLANIWQEIIKQ